MNEQYNNMSLLDLVNSFPDWKNILSSDPFHITIKEKDDYVLLKYSQFETDMSFPAAQQCRGCILRKNTDGSYSYVCRPFDKFFNYGEEHAAEIDWSTARIMEKVDGCFSGEDYVLLANNEKIKFKTLYRQFQEGRKIEVLSYDFETGKIEPAAVVGVSRKKCNEDEWLTVEFQGVYGEICQPESSCIATVTKNHVFFVKEGDEIIEKTAEHLVSGDTVLSVSYGRAKTEEQVLLEGKVKNVTQGMNVHNTDRYIRNTKFDLEVEKNHNYFCHGVLVHNSLMKTWHDEGKWHLSTNGNIDAFTAPAGEKELSFGDIFVRALGMDIQSFGSSLDISRTYMFELTSPDTQVVISYPDSVYYLSSRRTDTGEEIFDIPEFPKGAKIRYPKQYAMKTLDDVIAAARGMSKDEEGFVVNDASGNRIKVKSPEYLLAAKMQMNGAVTVKRIFQMLKNDILDDFLAYAPQHTEKTEKVLNAVDEFCRKADDEWEKVNSMEYADQKEFASAVSKSPLRSYLFMKRKAPDLTARDWLLRVSVKSALSFLDFTE